MRDALLTARSAGEETHQAAADRLDAAIRMRLGWRDRWDLDAIARSVEAHRAGVLTSLRRLQLAGACVPVGDVWWSAEAFRRQFGEPPPVTAPAREIPAPAARRKAVTPPAPTPAEPAPATWPPPPERKAPPAPPEPRKAPPAVPAPELEPNGPPNGPPSDGPPDPGLGRRAVAWVLAQPEPVSIAQIAAALHASKDRIAREIGKPAASRLLHRSGSKRNPWDPTSGYRYGRPPPDAPAVAEPHRPDPDVLPKAAPGTRHLVVGAASPEMIAAIARHPGQGVDCLPTSIDCWWATDHHGDLRLRVQLSSPHTPSTAVRIVAQVPILVPRTVVDLTIREDQA